MSRTYTPYTPPERRDQILDYREDWDPAADRRYGDENYPGDHPLDDEYADFAPAPADNRWMWVAGVAGAVLLVAVICTVVILGGGDSGSVSATVTPSQPSQPAPTAPRTVIATPAPTQSLAPERITTVTPTPSATVPSEPAPSETAPPEPPPGATAEPPPAPAPRTVTYRVTGERPLLDVVTVVYTDAQGALQTDVNVALPWSKTIELNPGVELSSVTATSVSSRLNCSITDADGNTLVSHRANTIIATCTR